MNDQATTPRSAPGLLLIGLFLGAGAMMMWLGRGRAAVAYMLASATILLGFVAAASVGAIPTWLFAPLGVSWTSVLVRLPVLGVAFVHSFRIRATALSRPWYSRWYIALPLFPTVVLAAGLSVRTFLHQPFNVPTYSMAPNLMSGDFVTVDKRAYGYGPYSLPSGLAPSQGRTSDNRPERGDLAVFRLPTNPAIDYIKRVVGLPGDRIRMVNSVLWINDAPVKLEAVTLASYFDEAEEFSGSVSFFRETLPNGRSYVVANLTDDGPADNTDTFVVPEGHYFTLGDNRDNSQDSRHMNVVGYIPEENFIGKVVLRFWNDNGVPLSDRPEETAATE